MFPKQASPIFDLFGSASSQEEQQQDHTDDLPNVLAAMMLSEGFDEWTDADMASVIRDLRGNKQLNVPADSRECLGMNK